MDKQFTLYQLMGMHMNGVMNGITEQDEDYQALLQEADKYPGSLESLHLPEETMKLIDRYVAGTTLWGAAMGCGHTCWSFPTAGSRS